MIKGIVAEHLNVFPEQFMSSTRSLIDSKAN